MSAAPSTCLYHRGAFGYGNRAVNEAAGHSSSQIPSLLASVRIPLILTKSSR